MFFLVRAGHPEEALDLARQEEHHIRKVDEAFVPNFASWVSSPTRCLSKARRDQLCAEYSQRLRHDAPADPFRLALYKLVARLDLGRRSAPVAITSVEDWAWFQLMLVHDGDGLDFAPHEHFTLEDFAKTVLKYGESHFDPNGTRPMTYCRMLLMSGHFERARLSALVPAYRR